MDIDNLHILTENETGFVSFRERENLIYVSFKNILLNFTLGEFQAFRTMAKSVVREEYLLPFPNGSRRIIMQTPFEGIHFSFAIEEINVLIDTLDEAHYMYEIKGLISKH
ncbi:DUF6686 family protein [Parapedobacter koreensis]|nr:DUF6686 family protein [Parapedobacter koreensis]